MTRSQTKSGMRMHRAIAGTAVALIHLVVAWIVTRPVLIESSRPGPDLQVVFIEQPKTKNLPVLLKTPPVLIKTINPVIAPPPVKARATPASAERLTSSRPALVVTDDEWARAKLKSADNGLTFERNVLISSHNPIPRPEAGRFRMRRQISPEDIVRGVSQVLGFWPPGYTDDPCSGLDKAVEMLMEPRNNRERGFLVAALQQREKYCK